MEGFTLLRNVSKTDRFTLIRTSIYLFAKLDISG